MFSVALRWQTCIFCLALWPWVSGVSEVESKKNCCRCLLTPTPEHSQVAQWRNVFHFYLGLIVLCDAHYWSLITNVTMLWWDPKWLWGRLKVQLLFNASNINGICFRTCHYRPLGMIQILFGLDRTCIVPAMLTGFVSPSTHTHTHTCTHSWTQHKHTRTHAPTHTVWLAASPL